MARGTAMTVLAAVFWGLVANSGEYLMGTKEMDAVQVTCLRLVCAGLILLGISAVRGGDIRSPWRKRRDGLELLITGVIGFGVCQASYFLCIGSSNGGTACVLQNTAPLFILLCTLLGERRVPRPAEVLSIAAVILGAVLLATHGDLSSLALSPEALVLGLISAAAVALYSILPARIMAEHGTLCITGWGLLLGGLLPVPFCHPWQLQGQVDGGAMGMFVFLVLCGSVATYGLYMYSLPLIGAVRAAVICLLEPVVATFVTVVFFHTPFVPGDYAGIAAILAGVLILTLFG